MIDDSEGNAKRIMLIGTALLTTIDVLIEEGLFTNSSKIRNIGLILSMFLQFAADESDIPSCNEDGWKAIVVEKADAHGVTIQGLVGIEELVQDIRDNADDSDSDDSDSDEENSTKVNPKAMITKMLDCYHSGEYSRETFNLGEQRSWKDYYWEIEVRGIPSHLSLKALD